MLTSDLKDTTCMQCWFTCPDCGHCFAVMLSYDNDLDMVICPNCNCTF